ncbi:uncharacterized protein [Diadema setosum]|uniref:uncharacterized protein n=1 Tax=Diadema setosum TaxID=31175 RepID=UPI003B3BC195
MCARSLLRFQLQLLGIFHRGEIHRRMKCLMCADALDTSEKPTEHEPLTSYLVVEYGNNNNDESGLTDIEYHLFEEDEDGFLELYGNDHTELNPSEDGLRGVESDSCVVCGSLQWDGDGKKIYNVAEIVPGSCCRVAGTVMSNVFMALLMAGICYNTWVYITLLFGREDEIMHLASYMTFSFALIGVTLICLYSKLRYYFSFGSYLDTDYGPIYWGWCGVLHQDYVTRRLQYLYHGGSFRIPNRTYLASCLIWPLVNTALQGLYFSELKPSSSSMFIFSFSKITFVTVGMLLFGTFNHTLYLLRHSFEVECNLLLAFIVEHEGKLDRCRMRLAETYRDYRLFRSSLGAWMPFIIALGVLGLTIHINWNYNVYSGHETLKASYAEVITLNVFIFSEKVMCLALPLIAIGGADLTYIWRQFHYALSRHRRSRHEYFWDRLMWYTRELDENDRPTGVALFLSVISLYTGLKLCSQNLDYSTLLN